MSAFWQAFIEIDGFSLGILFLLVVLIIYLETGGMEDDEDCEND